MELKDRKPEKKKIQVTIDKELSQAVDVVLEALGMTPAILITALYKRIATQGEIPFSLALTEREKALNKLTKAIDKVPTKQLNHPEELAEWLEDDE